MKSGPRPSARALAALAVAGLLAAVAPRPARAVTLVYSNDVMGELEPCGCRKNPTGGFVRKARLLQQLEDKERLQLDAGNLLFDTDPVPPALAAQAELQASYLIRAMNQLHHDAVVPGQKDFGLGVAAFDRLRKQARFPFLAANLARRKGGKFLEPYALFTRKLPSGKPLRIAVLGLVSEKFEWPETLRASSALAAARKWVPQLRKKADLVIALTHEGFDADEKLAQAVPGIDLVVGGQSQSFLQTPPRAGKAWIYQSSFRNQYVGLVTLEAPFKNASHRLVALDEGYEAPAEVPEMAKLVADFKAAVAELNRKEEGKLARAGLPAQAEQRGAIETWPRCAECHLSQYDFQRRTRHGLALHTLVQAKQALNKDCLRCHTVGLGDPHGFSAVRDLASTRSGPMELEDLDSFLLQAHDAKDLDAPVTLRRAGDKLPLRQALGELSRAYTPVQCENCHGPAGSHPFSPSASLTKAVSTDRCLKCHTAERAPEWYKGGKPDPETLAAKLKMVTCPAGE